MAAGRGRKRWRMRQGLKLHLLSHTCLLETINTDFKARRDKSTISSFLNMKHLHPAYKHSTAVPGVDAVMYHLKVNERVDARLRHP